MKEYGLRLTFGQPHTDVLPDGKLEWNLGEFMIVNLVQPPIEISSGMDNRYVKVHHPTHSAPLMLDPTFEERVTGDIRARIPNSITPEKEELISVRVTLFERPIGRRTKLPFPE